MRWSFPICGLFSMRWIPCIGTTNYPRYAARAASLATEATDATDAGAAEPTGSTGHGSLSLSPVGYAIGFASYGSGSETTTGGPTGARPPML
jgi:hypothetical protein